MALADDIASKVKGPKLTDDTEETTPVETDMKAGDHGKRMLAAIASKDAVALEAAVKDCVDSEY